MYISTSLIPLLFAASAVLAAPADLEKRVKPIFASSGPLGSVDICTNRQFGNCKQIVALACDDLGDDYDKKISSYKPTKGTSCKMYFSKGCPEPSRGSVLIDKGNPRPDYLGLEDKIRSIRCWDNRYGMPSDVHLPPTIPDNDD